MEKFGDVWRVWRVLFGEKRKVPVLGVSACCPRDEIAIAFFLRADAVVKLSRANVCLLYARARPFNSIEATSR